MQHGLAILEASDMCFSLGLLISYQYQQNPLAMEHLSQEALVHLHVVSLDLLSLH